ncbi:hypothetical protein LJC20_04510 [Eubacteriales bacterium OttesenSCG-928-M02]|nr:hypothetical protein [Eubacteriales bacterium OttesenSCG-928-M02]
MKQLFAFVYFFLFASMVLIRPAQAYLDPAATSYIIQIVAGVFIAVGAFFGIFWKKIRLFFRNSRNKALEKKLVAEAKKREQ